MRSGPWGGYNRCNTHGKDNVIPPGDGQSTLRIGSGRWSGRKLLPPPKQAETRPMTGSAKKSLLSILRPWLDSGTVLDLYCGTGTLGLEALSNGAARACFADRDPRVVERLRRNIDTCQADAACSVWVGRVEQRLADWLAKLRAAGHPVDIAFVDPPYAAARTWTWRRLERKVFTPLAEAMTDDGVVVLRLPDDVPEPESLGPLTRQRTKNYGQMIVAFFQRTD
ncbi:MAG: RsmD family RNA methyltransferase [Phycisphaerae bacterium]|nr:RsmD family RNA methyltransferase [Phycisphaerae bacterium]